MSCYLNFYLKDKKTNEYKNFLSFSSNNDLFQEIDENWNPHKQLQIIKKVIYE